MVQAHSAIPFPSSPSANLQSSASTPSQWDSAANQVDLAHFFSSPTPTQSSPSPNQKTQQLTPERPSQPHTPLTPPLTPASSTSMSASGGVSAGENSGVGNPSLSAFSTPARGPAAPPPTPASTGLLSSSNLCSSSAGPPSPVAVGTNNTLSSDTAIWTAPGEQRRSRPLPHRLEIGAIGGTGTASTLSPQTERSEQSLDLGRSLPQVEHVNGFQSPGARVGDDNLCGERYLLVGNISNDVTEDELRSAFHSSRDVKGICVRFKEAEGIVILAFYDCRLTARAERQITAPGQTYFGGRRLRAERMGATALKKLMGDSDFINETEGEILVTADGKIDGNALQSIVAGFGELRAFRQANNQAYIAEFYDCRNATNAMDALNGRSIFGIRLRLTPKHAAPADLLNRVMFPQSSENARQSLGSQPTSPLNVSDSFVRMHTDNFPFPNPRREVTEVKDTDVNADTSNSSPFHASRALPLVSPLSHALVSHGGAGRRISTGSVNSLHGGTLLHQSTSEQDLRRRAATNNAVCANTQDGWLSDHARRTSDTFCFDALRRAAGDLRNDVAQIGHTSISPLGRPRTRAISESSASPRVTSPSDGFSTAGMDVVLPGEIATREQSVISGSSGYHREERDRDSDVERSSQAHSRFPTTSDSSLGGPHTPSPGPVPYNVASYYMGSPSVLGVPGMLQSLHHAPGQYYLGSPAAIPPGMRYGYLSPDAGYSPGSLSVHSASSSPSSLHSASHSSVLHSPSRLMHGHLPSSARGALDVTRDPPNERNQVDLERIANGLDTRTTVMIKNIPNKLTDRDLIEYINRVCPRKIDFLYLRMDFQNGCNVGYAFVNFIHVQDLLRFAREKLGVKWNMYSSEKVLQMSYANYQGKEALVEKFKNSCVMDERESWRPKIFYSSGPNQGLPEPFPAPTHFRRKERSAQNRGALFLPNAHSHGSNAGAEKGGNGGVSSGMIGAPFRRPYQHPQNLARQDRY